MTDRDDRPDGNGQDPATADAFAELRRLLVQPEQERLEELQERLDDPELHAEDVGRVLPQAIRLREGADGELDRALGPTVERAIKTSVRRDPKGIADAIYPALGPAIRKAIAHALSGIIQSINKGVEHSLTPRGLKWRIEAWRSGVPFGEVVLRHTLVYRVEQVYLIHRETGLLLQHAAIPEVRADGADMVSGMLTAIRDFAADSFGVGEGAGLQTFSVGELTVRVEQGPRAVLAGVVRGHAPNRLREAFQDALESVHQDLGDELETFVGDAVPFERARPVLEDCLRAQVADPAGGRGVSPALWLVAAALVLAAVAWGWFTVREARRWDGYVDRLRAAPGVVVVRTGRADGRRVVEGLRDPSAVDPAVLLAGTGLDSAEVRGVWRPFLSLEPEMVAARARAAAAAAAERLGALRIPFASGAVLPDAGAGAALDSAARYIVELLVAAEGAGVTVAIGVVGRTDRLGDADVNRTLSSRRAEAVVAALRARGVSPARLETAARGAGDPLAQDTTEAARRLNRSVTFTVALDGAPLPR